MKVPIRISIPTPCKEKWETFSPTYGGRFCQSCSKTIVDFTKLGDEEIVAYLATHNKVCGRFHQDQMKTYRELPQPRIYPGFVLLRAGIIWLLLGIVSRVSLAGPMTTPVNTETFVSSVDEPKGHHFNLDKTVRGVVTSEEDGMTLPGVNIQLRGSSIRTVTDIEGRFEIRNLKEGDVLIFSFIGLQTMQYVVRSIQETVDIKMQLSMDVMGELLIEPAPQPTTVGFWSKLFRRN